MTGERQFAHGPPRGLAIVILVICGFLIYTFVNLAMQDEPPLDYYGPHGWHFSTPGQARVFCWIVAALSLGFAAALAFLIIFHYFVKQRIAIMSNSIIIPKSKWSAQEITIDYQAITDLEFSRSRGVRCVTISHPGGRFMIQDSWLPYKSNFDEICQVLRQRVKSHN